MNIIQITLFVFFIILIIILSYLIIRIVKNCRKNNKKKIQSTHIPQKLTTRPFNPNIFPEISTPTPTNLYKPKIFPENDLIGKTQSGIITGLALSGGGVRASSSSLGILQVLNDNSLLSQDYLNYVSCNSGSTWTVLPYFYTNADLDKVDPKYNLLGNYLDQTKDYTEDFYRLETEIGYNISNNKFNIDLTPEWWMKSIGKSFFKPFHFYKNDPNTNMVVGFDKSSAVENIKDFPNKLNLQPVYLKTNFPIPITIQSCLLQPAMIDGKTVRITDQTYLPFDSTPISTGFLYNPSLINTGCNNTFPPNLPLPSGRIKSHAFNYDFTKNNENIQNIWDPVMMSGISSMASASQLAPNEYVFQLEQMFNIDFKNQTSNNFNIIGDGYLVDDLGVISLLARGVKKIVAVWNPYFDQLFKKYGVNDPVSVGDFVFITNYTDTNNISYQFNVGFIKNVNNNNYTIIIVNLNILNGGQIIVINLDTTQTPKDVNNYFRKIDMPAIETLYIQNYIKEKKDKTPQTSQLDFNRKQILNKLFNNNPPTGVKLTITNLIINYSLKGIMY